MAGSESKESLGNSGVKMVIQLSENQVCYNLVSQERNC